MHRFRTPELFLGCFLTVAVFATGMLFVRWPYPQQPAYQVSATATHSDSKEKQDESKPSGWWGWLAKDAAGFFTFGLVAVGVGQALLFFIQLRYMRDGMKDAAIAANAAREGANTAARQLNMSERPWVGIAKIEFRKPLVFKPGAYFDIDFILQNVGKVPALDVDLRLNFHPGTQSAWDEFRMIKQNKELRPSAGGGDAIFPQQVGESSHAVVFTEDHVNQAKALLFVDPHLTAVITYRSPVSGISHCAAYLVNIHQIGPNGRMKAISIGAEVSASEMRYSYSRLGTYLD